MADSVLKKPSVQLKEEKQWPDAPSVPEDASELDRLTYPPGLIGHAVQYMVDTARLPDRWMALGTTMAFLTKGIDRKVIGPTGCNNVSYDAVLAWTGAGKQHNLNCGQILLRAMEVEDCYRASGIASVQSIEQLIEGRGNNDHPPCPNTLVVIDELGAWLSRITSKGQTGNVSEIPSLLSSLWGWPPETVPWKGSIKVGKDVIGIYSPAFSFIGFSTEEKFYAPFTRSDAKTGFINRLSVWNAGRGWTGDLQTPKYPWTSVPAWFGKALKEIAALPEAPVDAPMLLDLDGKVIIRDFHRLKWGDGAEEIYLEFEKSIRLMEEEDREIWARAPEIAVRKSVPRAFFRRSPTVDIEDIKWGIAVATASTRQLYRGFQEYSKEDLDQADLVRRLRDQFKRKGRLTWGQARKHCERSTNDYRKIQAAIDHLVQIEDIALDNADKGEPGRPTDTYRWLRTKVSSL
jgi:hypothetical protein